MSRVGLSGVADFPAAADSKPFFMIADECILLQWQK